MVRNRLIAVIIVKDGVVVQSEQFRHPHVIHYDAYHAVESFSNWNVDEIILLNISKDPNSHESFLSVVKRVSAVCMVPLCVGGNINSFERGLDFIQNGADKLIINTLFYKKPEVIKKLSDYFGRQCIVASIDIKSNGFGKKNVFVDRGRLNTGQTLETWVTNCENYGSGEIFLNNIDHDGMRRGYDLEALGQVTKLTNLPIIIFGGATLNKHFQAGLDAGASAIAAANIWHYTEMATKRVKRYLVNNGYNIRRI